MIKAENLIEKFRYALDNNWGYIYGSSGQLWTQAKQDAATRDTTIKYGSQWIGHYVSDCSGLFVWAFKAFGEKIYHGSNTIWNSYCSSQGKLKNGMRADGKELLPGTAVFLVKDSNRHHIGLYVGNGRCIEAKGTRYGVVESDITHWDEWGELKAVEYGEHQGGDPVNPTLRKGDRGEDVKRLQELLNSFGYKLDVDGAFGAKTEQAVKAFQQSHYLTADGIVGVKTWDALEKTDHTETFTLTADEYKRLKEAAQTILNILG